MLAPYLQPNSNNATTTSPTQTPRTRADPSLVLFVERAESIYSNHLQ